MKVIFLFTALFSWAWACQSGGGSSDPGYDGMSSRSTAPMMDQGDQSYGGTGKSEAVPRDAKIIRDGRMQIEVPDALKAKSAVDAIIGKYDARSAGEQFENNDYQATYTLRIRIPAEHLDALVRDLETIEGKVTVKTLDARDVTEEYIDLETRMANKSSYLEQYRTLLKSARTTEDILKISEQIRGIEEELESVEGRLRYLSDQVALSTLHLTLTQIKDYVYSPYRNINFIERLKESFSGGWYGFVSFSLFVVRLWPFVILIVVLWWVIRRVRRARRGEVPGA